jgi:hypothetical protein
MPPWVTAVSPSGSATEQGVPSCCEGWCSQCRSNCTHGGRRRPEATETYACGSRGNLSFDSAQILFVLAVLANVAYCAAHAVDVVLQLSTYRPFWLRVRWALLALGITFAAILANFFARGFFASGG